MYGKILIRCELVVRTGLHIGGSSAFSAIGAVDSPVVRDTTTGLPIIPGSSLKGKLRTLLTRSICQDINNMPAFEKDDEKIKRMFGCSNPVQNSRLQFADAFIGNKEEMMTTGITEVKFENTINRETCVANPRQIERVTPGTMFNVNIVYDAVSENELKEDMELLAKGFRLLQLDYLGGHGSRGSGRVSFKNFRFETIELEGINIEDYEKLFKEVEEYELFPV